MINALAKTNQRQRKPPQMKIVRDCSSRAMGISQNTKFLTTLLSLQGTMHMVVKSKASLSESEEDDDDEV